ncbi:MAG: hypothetical protein IT435_13185 [Phycisphaerales bacterium]|nr:hypothetical protein [Phycisphaerales bacterium]
MIQLTAYTQLELYLSKFARGELGLVLLLGRHGTGKSESVRRTLGVSNRAGAPGERVLYVEGHMQPFGLYRQLWEYRDQSVVLDDLDRLYADPDCVRLLKPLCNTVREKRLHWLTNAIRNDGGPPSSFTTSSGVILIANEWKSVNPNVRALEDRAIILHFCPSNDEVHRKVRDWFDDAEVYDFLGRLMPLIPALSMRHYSKGSQLRRAGLADWRASLLQMVVPDSQVACVLAVQHDPVLHSEEDRVAKFTAATGASRATYFRLKSKLSRAL